MNTTVDRQEARILLPRASERLVGHERARRHFLHALATGRAHHAWLISGAPGIGKATFAWHMARLLLAGAEGEEKEMEAHEASTLSPRHPVSRQIAAGSHPDLFLLRRTPGANGRLRAQIAVEDARALGRFLSLRPGQGGRRVVIVDAADEMNRETANAILKLLEEPPPGVVFLLVSHAPGRLLPTIRSRTIHLPLTPLNDSQVREALSDHAWLRDVEERRLAEAISAAAGSPGRALDLATSNAPPLLRELEKALAGAAVLPVVSLRIAEALAKKDAHADFALFTTLLQERLHRQMRDAAIAGDLPRAHMAAELLSEMRLRSGQVEALNLDRRAFVEWLVARLAGLWERRPG